jgi:hypothetical protein
LEVIDVGERGTDLWLLGVTLAPPAMAFCAAEEKPRDQVESGCEKFAQSATTQTFDMWIVTCPQASPYSMFR